MERTKRGSARNPGKNNFGFGGKLTFNLALPSGMFLTKLRLKPTSGRVYFEHAEV